MTGEIIGNNAMFRNAVSAIRAKQSIKRVLPEKQAFYRGNNNMATEYASSFTSPFMNMHWGSLEPPTTNTAAKSMRGRTAVQRKWGPSLNKQH
jgi:hypothetical protein